MCQRGQAPQGRVQRRDRPWRRGGRAARRNPDVDKISFTGSVGVGESIMRDGAATMKRVTLELGGKSPTILLDDAALDQAVPAALIMAFITTGEASAART